ncbi:hypothetical protein GA0070622_0902 [Micromonospora sediminicola]|uniref:Uncharacterized protein n=1 Tax=Micromonospora sediminicola TaxID=946078 RepID=A0A1A9B4I3_9ACTN|nr:hypothetical protein [Micromonospora sediminicola]SBT63934.1 hypothetical protein GA0070622_0902 [Micromonospora sediminicola]
MRPSPIPDDEMWPGARRMVATGPSGDLTDTDIAPVEVLVDTGEHTGLPRVCVRLRLEDGDLEKLAAGGTVWLAVYGPLPVFSVDVKGPGE